jgi:hypothetical protein
VRGIPGESALPRRAELREDCLHVRGVPGGVARRLRGHRAHGRMAPERTGCLVRPGNDTAAACALHAEYVLDLANHRLRRLGCAMQYQDVTGEGARGGVPDPGRGAQPALERLAQACAAVEPGHGQAGASGRRVHQPHTRAGRPGARGVGRRAGGGDRSGVRQAGDGERRWHRGWMLRGEHGRVLSDVKTDRPRVRFHAPDARFHARPGFPHCVP